MHVQSTILPQCGAVTVTHITSTNIISRIQPLYPWRQLRRLTTNFEDVVEYTPQANALSMEVIMSQHSRRNGWINRGCSAGCRDDRSFSSECSSKNLVCLSISWWMVTILVECSSHIHSSHIHWKYNSRSTECVWYNLHWWMATVRLECCVLLLVD